MHIVQWNSYRLLYKMKKKLNYKNIDKKLHKMKKEDDSLTRELHCFSCSFEYQFGMFGCVLFDLKIIEIWLKIVKTKLIA